MLMCYIFIETMEYDPLCNILESENPYERIIQLHLIYCISDEFFLLHSIFSRKSDKNLLISYFEIS